MNFREKQKNKKKKNIEENEKKGKRETEKVYEISIKNYFLNF